jgi:hypothetical protein
MDVKKEYIPEFDGDLYKDEFGRTISSLPRLIRLPIGVVAIRPGRCLLVPAAVLSN